MSQGPLSLHDFLAAHPADPSIVPPLVHITEGTNLAGILEKGFLDPEHSTLAGNDKATYLFVGKPAYLLKPKSHSDFYDAPVVFVFSKSTFSNIDAMFPMDSGAFSSNRYDNLLGGITREDMQVDATASSAAAIIEAFFGGMDNYMRSLARTPDEMRTLLNVLPIGFRILALAAVYSATRTETLDDRKSTIEVSTRNPFPLNQSMLCGIVLPEEWLSDTNIRNSLQKLNCQIESYELWPINRTHYQSELYRLCRRITRNM
jgi:hypothetical protein